jgi:hypothetical protein
MISLVEFLHSLKSKAHRGRCLAVLYYNEKYMDVPAMSVAEVRAALVRARIPRANQINVAQVFASAGALVDTSETNSRGHKLWHLTGSGVSFVRDELGLPEEEPEVAADVTALESAARKISDPLAQEFVGEAITCLQVGALRAAVVFAWTGAVRTLHDSAAALGWPQVEAAIQKHDARIKNVKKIEDFASVGDKTFLLAARDLTLIDKGQWTILQHALDLRNQCGHPSKYSPGPKKVSALIEDLIGIVFT